MPVGDFVMANDFVDVLKKKHAAKSYKKMVSFSLMLFVVIYVTCLLER